jgi:hypothetical protein
MVRSHMISDPDIRAVSPDIAEEPTPSADLQIKVVHSEKGLAVGLKVSQSDGSGVIGACVGLGAAVAIGVGGPAATIWAAHTAGFGPGWTCVLVATQLALARAIAAMSCRRICSR